LFNLKFNKNYSYKILKKKFIQTSRKPHDTWRLLYIGIINKKIFLVSQRGQYLFVNSCDKTSTNTSEVKIKINFLQNVPRRSK
jgi:hypothetical protein